MINSYILIAFLGFLIGDYCGIVFCTKKEICVYLVAIVVLIKLWIPSEDKD